MEKLSRRLAAKKRMLKKRREEERAARKRDANGLSRIARAKLNRSSLVLARATHYFVLVRGYWPNKTNLALLGSILQVLPQDVRHLKKLLRAALRQDFEIQIENQVYAQTAKQLRVLLNLGYMVKLGAKNGYAYSLTPQAYKKLRLKPIEAIYPTDPVARKQVIENQKIVKLVKEEVCKIYPVKKSTLFVPLFPS